MAELNGERLKDLLIERRVSQSAAAEAIGVTQPTIGRLIDGSTREFGKLLELAAFLKTPEYLVGWSDDRDLADGDASARAADRAVALADRRNGFRGAEIDETDMVMIRDADLVLGLGGAYLDGPVREQGIPFPRHWIRQFSDSPPDLLTFIRGKGDSMEPTINDGDICLLDLSRTRLDEQDALWAVAYGQIGMVKRLRALPDGTVKLMSDNPHVRDELATDGELHIIGRCCGVFSKK
jgi:phage repressor protein C with HTH and peptisase S24 domain/DNA-binding XRE family transcriptional regulator